MRDRDLVRLYWPVELRPAFDALFGVDDALAEVVDSSTQPALGAIRLAWWREALERLDGSPPPPEPRLQAVAENLVPRGVRGADLARLEQGWAVVLDEVPDLDRFAERGTILFELASRLLGENDAKLADAGRLFALADGARHGRIGTRDEAKNVMERLRGYRFQRKLRPLTALARLAARDARHWPPSELEATPARAAALLSHRLLGKIA